MKIQALDLVVDLNRDGTYSGWELWEAIKFLYRLPGNLITEALGHLPYVSSTLGIRASEATGYDSLNGLFAVTLSLIFWVLVVFILLTLASPEKDDDGSTASHLPNAMPAASTAKSDAGLPPTLDSPHPGHGTATGGIAPSVHSHLPVSRPLYAAPGKRPKRRRLHHLGRSLVRHAK